MRLLISAILLFLMTAGCGSTGSPSDIESGSRDIILGVTDTIGVLQGNESQVFGDVCDVSYSSTGDVLVLDGMSSVVSIFSPGGEFIRSLGGAGEAPWEFSWATSIAPMYSGELLVGDFAGRKIVAFDDTMGFSHTVSDFSRTAPAGIQPLPDGTYIGMESELWQDDSGELSGENSVRRWNTESTEPLATFLASPMFITILDDGLDVKPASIVFASSPDGSVYCAVSSDSIFQVFGYDSDGNSILEISEPWEKVARTPEEIEAESTATAMQTDESGGRVQVRIDVDPEPWHNAVENLCCDSQGRIWVRLGSEAVPTFRVYDSNGEFLFTASCPELESNGRQIRFQMTHGGIVAWDTAPEDYPKVYLLEMVQ